MDRLLENLRNFAFSPIDGPSFSVFRKQISVLTRFRNSGAWRHQKNHRRRCWLFQRSERRRPWKDKDHETSRLVNRQTLTV